MKILSKDFFLQSVATKNIMATFTVNVISPEDAVITLTADGYTQENNSITVPIGTTVHWEIEKLGYESKFGDYVVVGDSSITKSLTNLPMCTVSVSPIPLNATVSIRSIDGDWSNGGTTKSLRVPVGTELNISVVHPELNPYSTSVFAQEDTELDVILTNTITISTVPEDALVIINGDPGRSRTQQCNAIVEWEVSEEGYITKSGTLELNNDGFVPNRISDESGDNRLFVQLDRQVYAIQISVLSPSGVNIEAQIGDGEIISGLDSINMQGYLGDVIKWSATKEGYVSKSGEFVIDGKTSFEPIKLEVKKYLITVTPIPSSCTVTIESGSEILKTGVGAQYVNVEAGTELKYTVQSGTVVDTGELVVIADQAISVELPVGELKVDVFSFNKNDLGSSYYCYPVYANRSTIALSGNTGNLVEFTPLSGTLTKTDEKDFGFVKNYSSFESSAGRMVYFTGYHNVSGKEDTAMQVSLNPNTGDFSIDDYHVFGDSTWGWEDFVKTDNGWLGFVFGRTTSVYLDTEVRYSYSAYSGNATGYVQRPHLSKFDATSALGRKQTNVAAYTQYDLLVRYSDLNMFDTFVDSNGAIACAGPAGFAILDSSFIRTYAYTNSNQYCIFRLLGRISDFYYVISYPVSTSSSDQKTYLYVFYANGDGLKEKIEITVPGWTTPTTTVELCKTVPCVSQTGYLLAVGDSGSFGYNNPFVIRVQGY